MTFSVKKVYFHFRKCFFDFQISLVFINIRVWTSKSPTERASYRWLRPDLQHITTFCVII